MILPKFDRQVHITPIFPVSTLKIPLEMTNSWKWNKKKLRHFSAFAGAAMGVMPGGLETIQKSADRISWTSQRLPFYFPQ